MYPDRVAPLEAYPLASLNMSHVPAPLGIIDGMTIIHPTHLLMRGWTFR